MGEKAYSAKGSGIQPDFAHVNAVCLQHEMPVTCLDWHEGTNRIVSCAQDRSAFVWEFNQETRKWDAQLVQLRVDRAALFVKWSPDGEHVTTT